MQKIISKLNDNIIESIAPLPQSKRRFIVMSIIAEMALDVEGGDPIKAIGILECAKLDLHKSIDKQGEPTGNFEMLTN